MPVFINALLLGDTKMLGFSIEGIDSEILVPMVVVSSIDAVYFCIFQFMDFAKKEVKVEDKVYYKYETKGCFNSFI